MARVFQVFFNMFHRIFNSDPRIYIYIYIYPMDLVKAMAIIGYHRQVSGAPFGALFVHQPLGDQWQLPGGAAAPGSPKEPQECWAPKNRH